MPIPDLQLLLVQEPSIYAASNSSSGILDNNFRNMIVEDVLLRTVKVKLERNGKR